jgi:hypothetical protein
VKLAGILHNVVSEEKANGGRARVAFEKRVKKRVRISFV